MEGGKRRKPRCSAALAYFQTRYTPRASNFSSFRGMGVEREYEKREFRLGSGYRLIGGERGKIRKVE